MFGPNLAGVSVDVHVLIQAHIKLIGGLGGGSSAVGARSELLEGHSGISTHDAHNGQKHSQKSCKHDLIDGQK